MRRQETFFATSNKKKFESLSKILAPIGVELKQLEYDFDEGRDLTIETITQSKLKQAKEAFPDKKLIVDDRGFFIPPSENPGLSSPGMNDTTSTERALALA